ncbi:chaplin family protein [Streptomyces sp. NPDC002817]|uniref:chaplin family protein n=1 Tax=Streptomyces sp. NPDC088357 TaxID=3154655 RepID=UPI00342A2A40
MSSYMRVMASVLTAVSVAGAVVLGASPTQAAAFPCAPPEDVCAVDYVYGQPGVGTGNVIQIPVDIDFNVKP